MCRVSYIALRPDIALLTVAVGLCVTNASAQSNRATVELNPPGKNQLLVFRSDHFEMITDLDLRKAKRVLDQIEAVASNLDTYWGTPLKGTIKCLVVNDASRWPSDLLSDPRGRAKISAQSGITVLENLADAGTKLPGRCVIYACPDGYSPQRETVHAFCWQTFGRQGPAWLAEGLAEVGANWQRTGGAHCPETVANYLRADAQFSPADIVVHRDGGRQAWQVSSHRWALCHMLATHPQYSARFRQLSYEIMLGYQPEFAERFPELGPNLDADYRGFLGNLKAHRESIAATAEK